MFEYLKTSIYWIQISFFLSTIRRKLYSTKYSFLNIQIYPLKFHFKLFILFFPFMEFIIMNPNYFLICCHCAVFITDEKSNFLFLFPTTTAIKMLFCQHRETASWISHRPPPLFLLHPINKHQLRSYHVPLPHLLYQLRIYVSGLAKRSTLIGKCNEHE